MADGRQADVSLPAQQPIVALIPQLCALLSLKAEERPGGPWTLSTTTHGILRPDRSLDDAGIADADVIHLTAPQEAPESALVEDVVDDVAARLDGARTIGEGLEWAGDLRVAGCCALAAIVLSVSVFALATKVGGENSTLLLLVLLGVVGVGLAWAMRTRGGAFFGTIAVLIWATVGWIAARAWDASSAMAIALAVIGVGIGGLCFPPTVRGSISVRVAAAVLGAFALASVLLLSSGMTLHRAAGILAVVELVVVGLAPQFATARSGLAGLIAAEERARRVASLDVRQVVDVGRSVLNGIVFGATSAAVATVVTLLSESNVSSILFGTVLALIFALRSRVFSRASHIVPMLIVPVSALVTAAVMAPRWLGLESFAGDSFTAAALVLGSLTVLAPVLVKCSDVTSARLRQVANAVEATAVTIVIPLLLQMFNAYAFVRNLVS